MNTYYGFKIFKISTISIPLLVLVFIFAQKPCFAQPPIPPERPKILHVSPEYIKKLIEERNIKAQPLETEVKTTEEVIPPPQPTEIIEKDIAPNIAVPVDKQPLDKTTIQETTRQEVLNILDGKKKNVPLPPEKPILTQETELEKTLISFSLKPSEVMLDENIISFLKDHALNLFNKNKDMTMEINAYATPTKGEEHSAIRISLARSLEVRKWLMDNNISPSRLKLNSSRDDNDIESDDRIDLILVQ